MTFKDITDKTIVLTGATGGIGSAIAQSLSKQGARLILVGRHDKTLSQLNQMLGGQHLDCKADISTPSGRQTLIDFCENEVGVIDILVNNAGMSHFALLEKMDSNLVEQMIHTNIISQILLCQAFLPLLHTQAKSAIINIGSTFGSIGYPGFSVYCASKFALKGFSEALNRELADSTISIRYFAPRATQTGINTSQVIDMNKALATTMDKPDVVAQAFMIFLRNTQQRVHLGWPEKLFVQLNAIFPTLVDRAITKQLNVIKHFL